MIRRPRDWNRVISIVMTVGAVAIAVPWLWNKYENRPLWWDPVQHQIIHAGLTETLRMAAISVVGAAAVGLVLGTLLTISLPAVARRSFGSTSRSGAGCRSS